MTFLSFRNSRTKDRRPRQISSNLELANLVKNLGDNPSKFFINAQTIAAQVEINTYNAISQFSLQECDNAQAPDYLNEFQKSFYVYSENSNFDQFALVLHDILIDCILKQPHKHAFYTVLMLHFLAFYDDNNDQSFEQYFQQQLVVLPTASSVKLVKGEIIENYNNQASSLKLVYWTLFIRKLINSIVNTMCNTLSEPQSIHFFPIIHSGLRFLLDLSYCTIIDASYLLNSIIDVAQNENIEPYTRLLFAQSLLSVNHKIAKDNETKLANFQLVMSEQLKPHVSPVLVEAYSKFQTEFTAFCKASFININMFEFLTRSSVASFKKTFDLNIPVKFEFNSHPQFARYIYTDSLETNKLPCATAQLTCYSAKPDAQLRARRLFVIKDSSSLVSHEYREQNLTVTDISSNEEYLFAVYVADSLAAYAHDTELCAEILIALPLVHDSYDIVLIDSLFKIFFDGETCAFSVLRDTYELAGALLASLIKSLVILHRSILSVTIEATRNLIKIGNNLSYITRQNVISFIATFLANQQNDDTSFINMFNELITPLHDEIIQYFKFNSNIYSLLPSLSDDKDKIALLLHEIMLKASRFCCVNQINTFSFPLSIIALHKLMNNPNYSLDDTFSELKSIFEQHDLIIPQNQEPYIDFLAALDQFQFSIQLDHVASLYDGNLLSIAANTVELPVIRSLLKLKVESPEQQLAIINEVCSVLNLLKNRRLTSKLTDAEKIATFAQEFPSVKQCSSDDVVITKRFKSVKEETGTNIDRSIMMDDNCEDINDDDVNSVISSLISINNILYDSSELLSLFEESSSDKLSFVWDEHTIFQLFCYCMVISAAKSYSHFSRFVELYSCIYIKLQQVFNLDINLTSMYLLNTISTFFSHDLLRTELLITTCYNKNLVTTHALIEFLQNNANSYFYQMAFFKLVSLIIRNVISKQIHFMNNEAAVVANHTDDSGMNDGMYSRQFSSKYLLIENCVEKIDANELKQLLMNMMTYDHTFLKQYRTDYINAQFSD